MEFFVFAAFASSFFERGVLGGGNIGTNGMGGLHGYATYWRYHGGLGVDIWGLYLHSVEMALLFLDLLFWRYIFLARSWGKIGGRRWCGKRFLGTYVVIVRSSLHPPAYKYKIIWVPPLVRDINTIFCVSIAMFG